MNPSVNYGLWGNNSMFMNDDEPVGPFPVVSVSLLRGKWTVVEAVQVWGRGNWGTLCFPLGFTDPEMALKNEVY